MSHPSQRFVYTIPSDLAEGHRVIDEILQQLASHCWSDHDTFAVRMALEEAVVNAIRHGNCYKPDKMVRIECHYSPERVWIQIADEGRGFDPGMVPDCTDAEHIDLPGGRGLLLMRSFMNRVEYLGSGNVVVMEKQRSA